MFMNRAMTDPSSATGVGVWSCVRNRFLNHSGLPILPAGLGRDGVCFSWWLPSIVHPVFYETTMYQSNDTRFTTA